MKSKFDVDETFDCSNEDDAHRVVTHSAVLTAVDHTLKNALKLTNGMGSTKYCQWFFCRLNPECGQSSYSTNNYANMIKTAGCTDNLDGLSCDQCISE